MQRVEWDPTMETGDATVDDQHRGLIELFNSLLEAETREGLQGVPAVLERLCEYAIVHFSAEEELMNRVGYPDESVSAHLLEHASLTEQTRDIVLKFRTGQITSATPVVEFLSGWLSQHISKCDRQMVEFARTRG